MNKQMTVLILIAGLMSAPGAMAAPLTVGSSDNIQRVLLTQKGKLVTLKLISGDELSGTVKSVSAQAVHLGELTGKEFYDAVIATDQIAAIIVRTK